ncbi:MAG: MopE-related protein [Myxococcota bacterium]
MAYRSVFLAAICALVFQAACGDDGAPPGDAGPRADMGGPERCTRSTECDDGLFCNGAERCSPDDPAADPFGCVSSDAPCVGMEGLRCDEMGDVCGTVCSVTDDADGDGAAAIECGGTDCADDDPNRFPGNPEVCDDADHDEDCDATTVGARDLDGDGEVDARCCNAVPGEPTVCGTDCNDARRDVAPGATEVCEGVDNDCDGDVDEGVTVPGFDDRDGDGEGDPGRPRMACAGAPSFVANDRDCDDTNARIGRDFVEICDGLDNDCDGAADEAVLQVAWYVDADGDGFGIANADSPPVLSCDPIPGRSVLSGDCDDAEASVSPVAPELCNGRDDDCNGVADFAIEAGDLEDDDRDGVADARCAAAALDCDDLDPLTAPGRPEICDVRDNDCDGTTDESAGEIDWFLDADDDGYGDVASVVRSCEIVPGRLPRAGDCDDGDPSVRPGGLDGCAGQEGVDDDCDMVVDETEDEVQTFLDVDGDGFGVSGLDARLECTGSVARASAVGDCAPEDASVFPGATEVCDDGIDQDCDGFTDCDDGDCDMEAICARTLLGEIVRGDGQRAAPREFFASDVVLRVTDLAGVPESGVELTLEEGPYAAIAATATTDATGQASFTLRAATTPGMRSAVFTGMGLRPIVVPLTTETPMPGTVTTLLNEAKLLGTPSTPIRAADFRPRPTERITGLAVTADGSVYFASGRFLYRIDASDTVDVVATTSGQGARELFADDDGGRLLYVSGSTLNVVFAYDTTTGAVTTVAGGGVQAYPSNDGQPPLLAALFPVGVAQTPDGRLWISEGGRLRYLERGRLETAYDVNEATVEGQLVNFNGDLDVDETGRLVAAVTLSGASPCAGPALVSVEADLDVRWLVGCRDAAEATGLNARAYGGFASGAAIADSGVTFLSVGNFIRQVDPRSGIVEAYAGTGVAGGGGDFGPAVAAQLSTPTLLATTPAGDLLAVDQAGISIRRFQGPLPAAGGSPLAARVGAAMRSVEVGERLPNDLQVSTTTAMGAVLPGLGVRWSHGVDDALLDASLREQITLAPLGRATGLGFAGREVGPFTLSAEIFDAAGRTLATSPIDFTLDVTAPAAGTVFTLVFDTRFTLTSEPVAGPAFVNGATALSVADDGTIYFVAASESSLMALEPSGVVRRIAGTGSFAVAGDGGPGLAASFASVRDVCVDGAGDFLYVLDCRSGGFTCTTGRLRRIELRRSDRRVTTVAGGGSVGAPTYGNGGPAQLATLPRPSRCTVAPGGDVWILDGEAQSIRSYDATTGILDEVVGAGSTSAPAVRLSSPFFLAATPAGDLVVLGTFLNAVGSAFAGIARWSGTAWVVLVGGGTNTGEDVLGTDVSIVVPTGLTVRADGTICYGDQNTIRCTDAAGRVATVVGARASVGPSGERVPALLHRVGAASFLDVDDGRLVWNDGAAVRTRW